MKQEEIQEKLQSAFSSDVIQAYAEFQGQVYDDCSHPEKIREVCLFLRNDPDLAFNFLSFVGAVDRYPDKPRFEVVYQLYSLKKKHRFRIKALIDETEEAPASIDSVVNVWPTANGTSRNSGDVRILFNGHRIRENYFYRTIGKCIHLEKIFPSWAMIKILRDLPSRTGN